MIPSGFKKARGTTFESEVTVDAITRDGSNRFCGFVVVPVCDLLAVRRDMRLHPCDIPDEETHHVKNVGAEHNHILTTAAMILLATGVNGLDRADFPIVEHLFDRMCRRKIDRLMRNSHL